MNLKLSSTGLKNASIAVTGSKSESNRLLILQALFPNLTITNVSNSDDTKVLQKALQQNQGIVDIHHAGTAMRFLTAYYALKANTDVTLTGSKRMKERPMSILVDALKELGAQITYKTNDGFPPLLIKGITPEKTSVSLNANVSSQYISALMLVAASLNSGLDIQLKGRVTSVPYINMTLSLLNRVGIRGTFKNNSITIPPCQSIADQTVVVESDWSSASYYYSLVALSKNAEISLTSYRQESLQGDSALKEIYTAFGVETLFSENTLLLKKTSHKLQKHVEFDLSNTPDIAQTIAVTCLGLGISCKLTGLHTLKIKETDRLTALKTELYKLGGITIITNDTLELKATPSVNRNAEIDTYNDHRMAMAFAPLALKTDLTINDAGVVSKSYPTFWEDMNSVGITTFNAEKGH